MGQGLGWTRAPLASRALHTNIACPNGLTFLPPHFCSGCFLLGTRSPLNRHASALFMHQVLGFEDALGAHGLLPHILPPSCPPPQVCISLGGTASLTELFRDWALFSVPASSPILIASQHHSPSTPPPPPPRTVLSVCALATALVTAPPARTEQARAGLCRHTARLPPALKAAVRG